MSAPASDGKPKAMEWAEDHDVILLREILASDLFSFKKGSVARGERWESIAEKLNQVKTISFHLKDKRTVRDQRVLLQKKYKPKMHQEETASGISVDMSEIDVLLEELVGKEESLNKVGDAQARKQKEDKSKAEDERQKALERFSETKKRRSTENGNECEEKPKRQRRSARTEPLVEFMQEKAKNERELRQQELDLRRLEQEQNQPVMVTVLQQQQQQQQTNQAILSVIQKLSQV
ncbi:transcription factor SPT20 homolog isoform X4 [Orbicella faveolata]|uniref:transcription factor SPT20 homolog isoform X4 n=1 Tax=Orbicella faveolata TaxID=48498 RepID=UPI0009E2311A|nr:transcription factor SPT20 homolog isoform X4 [Orbicella faveolata]